MNEKPQIIGDEVTLGDIKGRIVDKYEKNAKSYRKTLVDNPIQIKCQKCGSTHNLMKYEDKENKKEFWFCKKCVVERANELAKQRRL